MTHEELGRFLKKISAEIKTWPEWRKAAAGINLDATQRYPGKANMKKRRVNSDGVEYFVKDKCRYYKCEIPNRPNEYEWLTRKQFNIGGMVIDKEAKCYLERCGW